MLTPTVTTGPAPPPSPQPGDEWFNPVTGRRYIWTLGPADVGVWLSSIPPAPRVTSTGQSPVVTNAPEITNPTPKLTMAEFPPTGALAGDFWYDTIRGFLFVYYNDGSTIQWVVANPGQGRVEGPPGLPGEQGPPGIIWVGEWDAVTPYEALDGVEHLGSSYHALVANSAMPPDISPDVWGLLAAKGDMGPPGGAVTITAGSGITVGTGPDYVIAADGTIARLVSPTFVGTPTAPTPPFNDASTRIANTSWAMGQIGFMLQDYMLIGSTINWEQIIGEPTEFPPSAHTQDWTTITGKPTSFPPSPPSSTLGWPFLPLAGGTLTGALTGMWATFHVDADAAVVPLVVGNNSSGAAAETIIQEYVGSKGVQRRLSFTGNYVQESSGSGINTRYSDFDTHYFRTSAGVLVATMVAGETAVPGALKARKVHGIVPTDGEVIGLFAGPTRGVRMISGATEAAIEGVDQTGVGSFQPLRLGGTQVTAPTPTAGDSSTKVATTAFVTAALAGGGASISVGATPPGSPTANALWWNSDASTGGGQLYIYYNDGNTSQWVPAAAGPMSPSSPGGDFSAQANLGGVLGGAAATIVWTSVQSGNAGGWLNLSNGRYTPPAGRYCILSNVSGNLTAAGTGLILALRKNGGGIAQSTDTAGNANWWANVSVQSIIDANGTDWFDVQGTATAGVTNAGGQFLAFPLSGVKGPPGDIGVPVANFNVRATANDTWNGAVTGNVFRSFVSPVKDYDPDNVWDLANAVFTAPSTGRYSFTCYGNAYKSVTPGQVMLSIQHQTAAGVAIRSYGSVPFVDTNGYGGNFSIAQELQMSAGEKVVFLWSSQGGTLIVSGAGTIGGTTATLTYAYGRKVV